MTAYDIIAQAVGLVAMVFNILSYQQKTARGAITFQLVGSSLFAVNFFMLGATVGGLMNLIAAFRAIVYRNKKRFRSDSIVWLAVFIALYVLSYVLTFTLLGKTFRPATGLLELLPVIAMTATTVSFRMESAKAIRRFGLISSPSWLVYNIANLAVGAIVCEAVSLVSIGIGMLRHDRQTGDAP